MNALFYRKNLISFHVAPPHCPHAPYEKTERQSARQSVSSRVTAPSANHDCRRSTKPLTSILGKISVFPKHNTTSLIILIYFCQDWRVVLQKCRDRSQDAHCSVRASLRVWPPGWLRLQQLLLFLPMLPVLLASDRDNDIDYKPQPHLRTFPSND